tara:strand:- start:5486 stop:7834 length:2349 start_codon:yes stop_codon:yes gene_type:complete
MSSDKARVLMQAMQGLFALATKRQDQLIAKYNVDAQIKAQKEAADLRFERQQYMANLENQLQLGANEYKNTLTQVEELYDKAEDLNILSKEYTSSIADSIDGTADGQNLLSDMEDTSLASYQQTLSDLEEKGDALTDITNLTNQNKEVIGILTSMIEGVDESIDLAEKVELVAQQDYNILNDDLSDSAMLDVFNSYFREYIVHEDGNVLLDENGNVRPVWNAKWEAFKSQIPNPEDRRDIQSKLNYGLGLLESETKAINNAAIKEKEDAVKTGDENFSNLFKELSDYFNFTIDDLPQIDADNVEEYEGYSLQAHGFAKTATKNARGGTYGKYGHFDFILGLEDDVEAAILTLAEWAAKGTFQVTSNHLEQLIADGDVGGIVKYLVIPKEGKYSNYGDLETYSGTGDGHHERFASKEYQDVLIEDGEIRLSSGKERRNAWDDIDLVKGSGGEYAAEANFVKYADLYTLIQNVKQWKGAFDLMELRFKDDNGNWINQEGYNNFLRDVGNTWAMDKLPMSFDSINELTEKLNGIFDQNLENYGFPSADEITSDLALDILQGTDIRDEDMNVAFWKLSRIREEGGASRTVQVSTNLPFMSDPVIQNITVGLFDSFDEQFKGEEATNYVKDTIASVRTLERMEYERELDKRKSDGEDIADELYSDENFYKAGSIDKRIDDEKIAFLKDELVKTKNFPESQVNYVITLLDNLPFENRRDILESIGTTKSKEIALDTFVDEMESTLRTLEETKPDLIEKIYADVNKELVQGNQYNSIRQGFIDDVLSLK